MRAGEEYSHMRGENSPYGDAWDFNANEQGITRFWRDGLRRNKQFANVITLGMRGERDTAIMAKASREDNIAFIQKVLRTQNQLICEEVSPDLHQVARQIVLFSEVEAFFYPDEQGRSLVNDPELDGVTIMLSDANTGFMRTLPQASTCNRRGGWGMYYHMDMHGGPASFEWIGSTAISRVWDQMSTAWDFGVRTIWVTNVGDIATNECALAYFLDMAYDIDTYGSNHPNNYIPWLRRWVNQQFGDAFDQDNIKTIEQVIQRTTVMLERRKHEVMDENTYHPTHYAEAQELLDTAQWVLDTCQQLRSICPKRALAGFVKLVWYPAMGTANLMKAWILAGRNSLYAQQNRVTTNTIAHQIEQCIEQDSRIVEYFHNVAEGKFNGFGLSEHFGFRAWCADNNQYPVMKTIFPAKLPRMIVSVESSSSYNIGSSWIEQPLTIRAFDDPRVNETVITIATGSTYPAQWRIVTNTLWLSCSKYVGTTSTQEDVTLRIDRSLYDGSQGSIDIYGLVGERAQGYFSHIFQMPTYILLLPVIGRTGM